MSNQATANTELFKIPIGARVRALRKQSGLTQAALLDAWDQKFDDAPTQGWISQIESGALSLSKERAGVLAQLFGLSRDELPLLLDPIAQTHNLDIVGYMDWQAVRYWVGNYYREKTKDREEEIRAQGVLNVLGEALREDEDFYTLHKSAVGRVENLTDRTETHRWLLLVEAAFMEPFAPYEPMKRHWRESRIPMIIRLAERMEVSLTKDAQEVIESARHATMPNLTTGAKSALRAVKAYSLDKEIKQLELGSHSIYRAPLISQSCDPVTSLLAGAALVGNLGWNFVGGVFLASRLDAQGRAVMNSGLYAPVVSHRRLLGSTRGKSAASRRAWTTNESTFIYPDFLLSIGHAVVSQELGKLLCLMQLQALSGETLDFAAAVPGLDVDLVRQRIEENQSKINNAYEERLQIDYRLSPGCRELKSISSAFSLYLDRFPA